MADKVSRRRFLKETAVGTAGAAMFLSCEEKSLTERQGAVDDGPPVEGMPTGKIGDLTISRLICGGNLISGYAHARDLSAETQVLGWERALRPLLDSGGRAARVRGR